MLLIHVLWDTGDVQTYKASSYNGVKEGWFSYNDWETNNIIYVSPANVFKIEVEYERRPKSDPIDTLIEHLNGQ